MELPVLEVRAIAAAERESEIQRLSEEEARRPFNLSKDLMIRTLLLRVSDEEHVLLLTMHHIVSDGRSIEVFVAELAALYEGHLSGRITLGGILAVLIAGAFLWWSWGGGGSKPAYVYSKASYGTVTLSVRVAGTLAARDSLDITAPAGGRVLSVLVKSGDRVVKDQVLARLQSDSARNEMLRAETEAAAMQARVAQGAADTTEARAAALRAKNDSQPSAYDTAQANLARALARMSELQAQLREAQAQLTAARTLIGSLDVRAPIDGIVLKSDIEPGQYVSVAVGGRALFTLASGLSQLKLAADIPEAQLGDVHVGEPARFTVPAFPKGDFPAILTALDLWPKKETKDGKDTIAYPATISADNPDGRRPVSFLPNANSSVAPSISHGSTRKKV
jgi:HlyD family secretion protein